MSAKEILLLFLLPFAVSLVIGVLIVGRSRGGDPYGRAWALAIALGTAAGLAGAYGKGALLPQRAEQWLFWIALAGGVAGFVDANPGGRWWKLRWLLRMTVTILMLLAVLRPLIDNEWSWSGTGLRLFCFFLAVVTAWSAVGSTSTAAKSDPPRIWIVLMAIAGIAGLQLVSGSSIVLAQLTAVVLMALLPMVLMAWWARGWSGMAGGAAPITVTLAGLLLMGVYYAKLEPMDATLAIAAVLPACPCFREGGVWRMSTASRIAFAAILIGVPLVFRSIAYWNEAKDAMGY